MGRVGTIVGPIVFWGAIIWYFVSGGAPTRSETANRTVPSQAVTQTGYGAPSDVPEGVRQKALTLLEATYDGQLTRCQGNDVDGVYLAYCLKAGLEKQGGGLYAVLGAVPSLFSVYPINGKAKGHLEGRDYVADEFEQRTRVGTWNRQPIDIGFAIKMLATKFD